MVQRYEIYRGTYPVYLFDYVNIEIGVYIGQKLSQFWD